MNCNTLIDFQKNQYLPEGSQRKKQASREESLKKFLCETTTNTSLSKVLDKSNQASINLGSCREIDSRVILTGL